MTRTIATVLSAGEVAAILARHILDRREIETAPGSNMSAEMLAIFNKDAKGVPQITQFRIDVTVDEVKEGWRG